MPEQAFTLTVGQKSVPLILSSPSSNKFSGSCFVLGHGASGDATSGNLPAIASRLSASGVTVLRYSCAGQLPARIKVLQGILDSDHEALKPFSRWVLSGHSMGARTACAVARERQDVCAVVLFSFPLHPPGPPKAQGPELRDKDLVALRIPVMIVRGSKDPFSTDAHFQEVMGRMQSARCVVEDVEAGNHSLATTSKAGEIRFEKWISATQDFVTEAFSEAESSQTAKAAAPDEDSAKKRKRATPSSRGRKTSKTA